MLTIRPEQLDVFRTQSKARFAKWVSRCIHGNPEVSRAFDEQHVVKTISAGADTLEGFGIKTEALLALCAPMFLIFGGDFLDHDDFAEVRAFLECRDVPEETRAILIFEYCKSAVLYQEDGV